jgi:hypothetical protein
VALDRSFDAVSDRAPHPLQNRVTPFDELVALPGRGLMMGNRGVLHDEHQRIVRYAQVRRWIACRTEFRGRKRIVMSPKRYTELFFLDEATAFAAGHRPCAECRNADYKRFRTRWLAAHGGSGYADDIDRVIDDERRERRRKRTHHAAAADLPDGSFIVLDGAAWLVRGDTCFRWTDRGYTERRPRPRSGEVELLTPPSLVALLRLGYALEFHPTSGFRPAY